MQKKVDIMKRKGMMVVLLSGILAGLLAGCGKDAGILMPDNDSGKKRIVCTTFPQYDWVQELIKGEENRYEVTLLLQNGVDMHSYQPTVEDMVRVGSADLFLYVGGESDVWVEDALQEAVNPKLKAVNFMETLAEDVREEEIVEGMQEKNHSHNQEKDDEIEYDEHVWLSLRNAEKLVETISDALIELEEGGETQAAESIRENTEAYLEKLRRLDASYEETVREAELDTLLFADRFPFLYLTKDYGLSYYAAFPGCSAETGASFETIAFLSGKADELQLPAVIVMENSDKRIAEAVVRNTEKENRKILVMDSLQSVKKEDMEAGTTYLSVMEENLEVLKQALN